MVPRRLARLGLGLCCLAAEAFVFERDEAPGPLIAHARWRFFASEGASMHVEQLGLEYTSADGTGAPPVGSVILAMVPSEAFARLDNGKTGPCDSNGKWYPLQALGEEVANLEIAAGQLIEAKDVALPRGGEHVLMVINCGDPAKAKVGTLKLSGTALVRNTWGYLDEQDHPKQLLYIAAFFLVSVGTLAFMAIVQRQEEQVREMQYRIGILALMHLLEIGAKIFELSSLNAGKPGLSGLGDALFLAKCMYAGMFVLQTLQGQGVTVSALDTAKTWTTYILVLFVGLAFPPKLSMLGVYAHMPQRLDGASLLKLVAPVVSVVFVGMLVGMRRMAGVVEKLRKVDDTGTLEVVVNYATLAGVTTLAAGLVLGGQLAAVSRWGGSVWNHAVWNDLGPLFLSSAAIGGMMYISMTSFSPRLLEMAQVSTQEGGDNVELGDLANDSSSSDKEQEANGVEPDRIGAFLDS